MKLKRVGELSEDFSLHLVFVYFIFCWLFDVVAGIALTQRLFTWTLFTLICVTESLFQETKINWNLRLKLAKCCWVICSQLPAQCNFKMPYIYPDKTKEKGEKRKRQTRSKSLPGWFLYCQLNHHEILTLWSSLVRGTWICFCGFYSLNLQIQKQALFALQN